MNTWVIGKEDKMGAHCDSSITGHPSLAENSTKIDKENMNDVSSKIQRTSIRSFRFCKPTTNDESSSECESDSKKNGFKYISSSPPKIMDRASSTALSLLTSANVFSGLVNIKGKESLSSEEISVMLSECDSSYEQSQENNRDHLHSIENFCLIKDKNQEASSISASSKDSVQFSSDFKSVAELKSVENSQVNTIQNVSKNHQSLCKYTSASVPPRSKFDFQESYNTFHSTTFHNKINNKNKMPLSPKNTSKSDAAKSKKPFRQKLFQCKICNYCNTELLLYKSHQILFHSEEEVLNCEYCEYQTTQCANLATHIRVHFQLECPYCDYRSPLKTLLDSHVLAFHAENRNYQCEQCDYVCKSLNKFTSHLLLHSISSSKYQCDYCKLGFVSKQNLRMHIKKHSSKMDVFKCRECDLHFSHKHKLKLHLKSHDQAYCCSICKHKSTSKNKLRAHMKVHNKATLKCQKCSLVFSRKSSLKFHMKTHFIKTKCKFCPFQSKVSNELMKHVCINKLYNVQKQALNFENMKGKGFCEQKNEKVESDNAKYQERCQKLHVKEFSQKRTKAQWQIESGLVTNPKPINHKKIHKTSSLKPLLTQQNLPMKKTTIARPTKCEKEAEHVLKGLEETNSSNFTLNKQKEDRIRACKAIAINRLSKANKKIETISKNQERYGKIIKNPHQSSDLSSIKLLFHSDILSKEMFSKSVRFTNNSYIQCYYQNQSTSMQGHLDRHLRQSLLLSCRFCNYKTNSSHLLQQHTVKNHLWDPAVFKGLFK